MNKRDQMDGKKPTLAEMFDVAEERAKPSNPDAKRKDKPKWTFSARPTGGLKPDGFKAKAEMKF
jgi:hypothetical protein